MRYQIVFVMMLCYLLIAGCTTVKICRMFDAQQSELEHCDLPPHNTYNKDVK